MHHWGAGKSWKPRMMENRKRDLCEVDKPNWESLKNDLIGYGSFEYILIWKIIDNNE